MINILPYKQSDSSHLAEIIDKSNTGIYVITSPTNRKYIGQSRVLKARKDQYRRGDIPHQKKILASINKYGWESHSHKVLVFLQEDILQNNLDIWEQFFIDYYRNKGYRLMNIKEAGSHGKHHKETRKLITLAGIGRKRTEESKKKTSDSLRGEKHPYFGKKLSIEHRKNIGDGNRGKPKRKGAESPLSQAVIQYTMDGIFIKEWGSTGEARRAIGGGDVSGNARGIGKSCKGFIFKYKKDTI